MSQSIHYQNYLRRKRAPSGFRWLIAWIGLGTACTLIYIGNLIATASHYEHFKVALDSEIRNGGTAAEIIKKPLFSYYLSRTNTSVRAGFEIVDAVEKSYFKSADRWIARGKLAKINGVSSLRSKFNKIKENENELLANYEEIENTKDLKERSRKKYTLVATNLYSLFGLPQDDLPSNMRTKFYQKGVLQGLPLLPGIPDSLNTNYDLAATLAGIKKQRRIKQKTRLKQEDFFKKMDDLRIKAIEIDKNLKKVDLEIALLKEEQKIVKNKLRRLKSDSFDVAIQILTGVAKQKLNPGAEFAYQQWKEFESKWII